MAMYNLSDIRISTVPPSEVSYRFIEPISGLIEMHAMILLDRVHDMKSFKLDYITFTCPSASCMQRNPLGPFILHCLYQHFYILISDFQINTSCSFYLELFSLRTEARSTLKKLTVAQNFISFHLTNFLDCSFDILQRLLALNGSSTFVSTKRSLVVLQ